MSQRRRYPIAVSRLLLTLALFGSAAPARADCLKPVPDDWCFPAAGVGEILETTTYKVAYVQIWRTNAKMEDVGETFVDGFVAKKPGEFRTGNPVSIRFINDVLRKRVAEDPKLPDFHQKITDQSKEWTSNGPDRSNFGSDAAQNSLQGPGATSDLSIEALSFDPTTGTYVLIDVIGAIRARYGLNHTVYIPDLFADTNGDQVIGDGDYLYSLVDMNVFLDAVPAFALGDSFAIIDGKVDALPGMLFSTAPFSFDPQTGFSTSGLFTSSPILSARSKYDALSVAGGGQANAQHGLTATPEPASWAMLITGFGMIGGTLRVRRRAVA